MDLQLDLVGVDNLLAAILALHQAVSVMGRAPSRSHVSLVMPYDGSGLGGLDGETVGLDGSASAGLFTGLLLAGSLQRSRGSVNLRKQACHTSA